MNLTISKETIEGRSDTDISIDRGHGGPGTSCIEAPTVDLSTHIVEHVWLVKSKMRWVRNDRSPLNALRWFVKDSLGLGDPPSRVEVKRH